MRDDMPLLTNEKLKVCKEGEKGYIGRFKILACLTELGHKQ